MSGSLTSTAKFVGFFPPPPSMEARQYRHLITLGKRDDHLPIKLNRNHSHLGVPEQVNAHRLIAGLSTDGKLQSTQAEADRDVTTTDSLAAAQVIGEQSATIRGASPNVQAHHEVTSHASRETLPLASSSSSIIPTLPIPAPPLSASPEPTSPADSFLSAYSRSSSVATTVESFVCLEFTLPVASTSTSTSFSSNHAQVTSKPLEPITTSWKGKEKDCDDAPRRLILRLGPVPSLSEEAEMEEDEEEEEEEATPDYSMHQSACHFHKGKGNRPIMSCVNFPSCSTIWCQKCLASHFPHVDFTINQTFECPVCTDNCTCSRCRKKRGESDPLPPAPLHLEQLANTVNLSSPAISPTAHASPRSRKRQSCTAGLTDDDASLVAKRSRRKRVVWRKDQEDYEYSSISVGKPGSELQEEDSGEAEQNRVFVPTGDVVVRGYEDSDEDEDEDEDEQEEEEEAGMSNGLDAIWDLAGMQNPNEQELSSLENAWEHFEALIGGGSQDTEMALDRPQTVWHPAPASGRKRLSIVGGTAPDARAGASRRRKAKDARLQLDTNVSIARAPFATSPSLAATLQHSVVGPFTSNAIASTSFATHSPLPSPPIIASPGPLSAEDLERQAREVRLAIQRAHERAGDDSNPLFNLFETPAPAVAGSAFLDSQQLPPTRAPSISSSSDGRSHATHADSGSRRRSTSVSTAPSSYNPFDRRSVLAPELLANMSNEALGEIVRNLLLAGYDLHKAVAATYSKFAVADWDPTTGQSTDTGFARGFGFSKNSPLTISTELNRTDALNLDDVLDERWLKDPPGKEVEWPTAEKTFGWEETQYV